MSIERTDNEVLDSPDPSVDEVSERVKAVFPPLTLRVLTGDADASEIAWQVGQLRDVAGRLEDEVSRATIEWLIDVLGDGLLAQIEVSDPETAAAGVRRADELIDRIRDEEKRRIGDSGDMALLGELREGIEASRAVGHLALAETDDERTAAAKEMREAFGSTDRSGPGAALSQFMEGQRLTFRAAHTGIDAWRHTRLFALSEAEYERQECSRQFDEAAELLRNSAGGFPDDQLGQHVRALVTDYGRLTSGFRMHVNAQARYAGVMGDVMRGEVMAKGLIADLDRCEADAAAAAAEIRTAGESIDRRVHSPAGSMEPLSTGVEASADELTRLARNLRVEVRLARQPDQVAKRAARMLLPAFIVTFLVITITLRISGLIDRLGGAELFHILWMSLLVSCGTVFGAAVLVSLATGGARRSDVNR